MKDTLLDILFIFIFGFKCLHADLLEVLLLFDGIVAYCFVKPGPIYAALSRVVVSWGCQYISENLVVVVGDAVVTLPTHLQLYANHCHHH